MQVLGWQPLTRKLYDASLIKDPLIFLFEFRAYFKGHFDFLLNYNKWKGEESISSSWVCKGSLGILSSQTVV